MNLDNPPPARSRCRAWWRDPEIIKLATYADTVGVADRVRFTGPVTTTRLPALLRSTTLVVAVPRRAPFGTTTLQAMACGVPVIAAAVGA